VLHTVGYIVYAVSTEGWLIMTSKLLSGFFIGAELTLALSYFAESSIDYQAAMKELGKPVESSEAVRNNLFALHNIGVNIGYFLGPGNTALLTSISSPYCASYFNQVLLLFLHNLKLINSGQLLGTMWHLEYYSWYYKSYYFVEKAPSKLVKDANCVDLNFITQAQVYLKYLYPQNQCTIAGTIFMFAYH
jgi:MFS family permease